jgi:hypothetical protein
LIKGEVMDEVEAIADNDEWELVGEFGFFEEVLDLFWVIKVTFPADALHLMHLTSTSGSLDVLKVNFGVLVKVENRAKVIVEPCADSLAA